MQNDLRMMVDVSTYLTSDGIVIYIGSDDADPVVVNLQEEVKEFLNDICDGDGKVYEETSDELQSVIDTFKSCLQELENAKR
jgi:hypothetical protein